MFDIGWSELMVVAVLTIIVVGPKELPRVLRTVMALIRKVRAMAGEFQSSLEDIAREADVEDIQKALKAADPNSLEKRIEEMVDPEGNVKQAAASVEADMDSIRTETTKAQTKANSKPKERTSSAVPPADKKTMLS